MAQSRWPRVGDTFDSVKSFREAAFAQADRDGVELTITSSHGLACRLKQHYAKTETGTGPRCSLEIKLSGQAGVLRVAYTHYEHDCSSQLRHERAIAGKTVHFTKKRCLEYPNSVPSGTAPPPRKRQKLVPSERKSSVKPDASSDRSSSLSHAHRGGEPSVGDTFGDKTALIATLSAYSSERDIWLFRREPVKDRIAVFSCSRGDGGTQIPSSHACPFSFKAMLQKGGTWRITNATLEHSHASPSLGSRTSAPATRRIALAPSGVAPIANVSSSTPKPQTAPASNLERVHIRPSARQAFFQPVQITPAEPADPNSLVAFFLAFQPALPPSTIETGIRQLGEIGIEGTADLARFVMLDSPRRQYFLNSVPLDKADARGLLERFEGS